VTLIPAEKLASEDLSRYQTSAGIRAYERQKDVMANNKRCSILCRRVDGW